MNDPINNPGDFIEIVELDDSSPGGFSEDVWTQYTMDASQIAGNPVYIAFGYDGVDAHDIWIDDYEVSNLKEPFEVFPPEGWTIIDNGGDCVWESTETTGMPNYAGGEGFAATADSDDCGNGTTMDTELTVQELPLQ